MFAPVRALHHLAHLRKAQQWPEEQIINSQLELLERRLFESMRRVPYYRESLRDLAGSGGARVRSAEEFRQLPLLTKGTVKANFPDRMVSEGLSWSRLYPTTTSGTTDRMMIFQDQTKRDWDRAADLMLELAGNGFRPGRSTVSMPPDACVEVCGAENGKADPSLRNDIVRVLRAAPGERTELRRRLRRRLMSEYLWRVKILPSFSHHGTAAPGELLSEYLETIATSRPSNLKGLPMALYVLAKHAKATGIKLRGIRTVRPTGGKFSPRMAREVEQAFGAQIRENYGTAELGTIAFDCGSCSHQHLLGELFFVEVLVGDRPAVPGELGEVIITDLRNAACPLIRYKVGDVARVHSGPCSCGFRGMLFTVEGRVEETIVSGTGQKMSPSEATDWMLSHPEIAYSKLIQTGDRDFLVELVPSERGGRGPSEAVLTEELSNLLREAIRVRVRVVKSLSPEGSGKYRLITSKSHARFHL